MAQRPRYERRAEVEAGLQGIPNPSHIGLTLAYGLVVDVLDPCSCWPLGCARETRATHLLDVTIISRQPKDILKDR